MNSFSIKTQYVNIHFWPFAIHKNLNKEWNFFFLITESKCMENLISDHPTIHLYQE